MSLIHGILEDSSVPYEARQAALDRVHKRPGLPTAKGSTEPFWLRDPHPTVAKAHSETLPKEADVVIIGSGITGLSVAWTVLQTAKEQGVAPPSVVMLEARDACSGATGRNGGHMLETVLEYHEYKEQFGRDVAMKLTRFQLGHLPAMEGLLDSRPEVRQHSQLRKVEFVSISFDEESFEEALKCFAEFKKDMPEESSEFASHTGEKLTKDFQLSNHAVGAITGPAGAVWPYRLVTQLLAELQRDFASSFTLETNTPVSEMDTVKGQPFPYNMTTCRGTLQAKHVVHCTNGYVGHLVPGFHGRVFPLRGQMSAQGPGEKFENQSRKHSWLLNYHEGFDYLTQLPGSEDGTNSNSEMMFGGGLASARSHGLEEMGVSVDDSLDLYVDIHLSGALSAVFGREHWGPSTGVKSMWTGIMGFSSDGFPWVGELPVSMTGRQLHGEAEGAEWAAVGYSGEGMVHAWLSGKALGMTLLARQGLLPGSAVEEVREWFPEQLGITEERIRRAVLPRTLSEL